MLTVALAYAAIALAWAGNWIVGKLAVGAVPPIELSALRFAVTGIVVVIGCRAFRIPLGTRDLRAVVIAALFGITGYSALVFVALTMSPVSDSALIVPTMVPVLTALAATLIGERLTRSKIVGFIVSSVGATLVIVGAQGVAGAFSQQRLIADLMALGGAACWAVYGVVGRIALRDRSPLALVALTSLVGAAGLAPLTLLEHGFTDVPSWPAGAFLAVAYLSLIGTVLGFGLFYWAVRRFGAAIGAMSSYLVPVATLALAYVLLGERAEPLQLVGGTVILLGVRLATLSRTVPVEAAA